MAVALVPSPPSPPSTESQQKLELDEFLRDYANGSFPMDRPPDRPKKLQVKTTLANSHYPSSSSSTTPTMAPSLPLPIHEYEDFSSYVEDFWNANRALPQIPSTNDVKREKVIRRFSLDSPSMWPCIDRCARMANAIFKSTILVTLLSADTEIIVASVDHPTLRPGDPYEYDKSVCSHTVLRRDSCALEVPDTQQDWRFADMDNMPRYYAGQPFSLPSNPTDSPAGSPNLDNNRVPVGVLCLIDGEKARPRLSDAERALLKDIGLMISEQVEHAWQTAERQRADKRRLLISRLLAQALRGQQSKENINTRAMQAEAAREMRAILGRDSGECDLACILDFSPSVIVDIITSSNSESPAAAFNATSHGAGWETYNASSPSSNGSRRKLGVLAEDLSARARESGYDLKKSMTGSRAIGVIMKWLREYIGMEEGGKLAYHNGQGPLVELLPEGTQSYVAIPLFNGSKPMLLAIVATCAPHSIYEPPEIAFVSNVSVISLGALIQQRLVEADTAKTAFVSMISHELRTPLHGMLSQLELIREYAKPEHLVDIGDLLETAEVCGLMLRDVLNDVLDFGKMEITTATGPATSTATSNNPTITASSSNSTTAGEQLGVAEDQVESEADSVQSSRSLESTGSARRDSQLSKVNLATLARDVLHVSYGRRRQWDTVMSSGPITPGSEVEVSVEIEDLTDPLVFASAPSPSTPSSRGSSRSEPEHGDWWAMVDVAGLRRVLMNLASNALKYTPRGKITLTLEQLPLPPSIPSAAASSSSASSSSDDLHRPTVVPGTVLTAALGKDHWGVDDSSRRKRLVQFTMKDTGIGMSREFQQYMFTPFSQENMFNPGSGLGMSISDRIVQRMGGAIDVSSELGVGTTVKVTLLVEFISNNALPAFALQAPPHGIPPSISRPLPSPPAIGKKTFTKETISMDLWDSRRSYMDMAPVIKTTNTTSKSLPIANSTSKNFLPVPHPPAMPHRPSSSSSVPSVSSDMTLPASPSPLSNVIGTSSSPSPIPTGPLASPIPMTIKENMALEKEKEQTLLAERKAEEEKEKEKEKTLVVEEQKLKVLVVDDNKIGRKILTTLLSRRKGADAVVFAEAEDGKQAVDVFEVFQPHLVWTDVSMPIMDGIEAARCMRIVEKSRGWARSRIVAITGLSQSQTAEILGDGEGSESEDALDEWLVKGQTNLKTLITGLEKIQKALFRQPS